MKFSSTILAYFAAQAVAGPMAPIEDVTADITFVPREPRAALRKTGLNILQSDNGADPAASLYNKTTRAVDVEEDIVGDLVEDMDELEKRAARNVAYSSNWAGAVLNGNNFKTAQATIKVPNPAMPRGGKASTQYAASVWVGIDGSSCQRAILQTGIDVYFQNGKASFDAWYEWYPDYAYTFQGFAIRAGDTLTITVSASSNKAGFVTIQNLTTRKQITHNFANQRATLCLQNAEFIVEDFQSGGSLVPFVNFGQVAFSNAVVRNNKNQVQSLAGASILNMRQNNKVVANCGASSNLVSCKYTG
ncbi:uncharacterized protein E0L32_001232 [Thyridium curvatum]|uniref:Aspergillopepsin-2 n=1 Tax=Thyridium curvatum TaxID=1093900 RepID=A0A507AIM7_9PEZI|nr:uncharacterized protein E0L32_001232 [Thyridium curvatum]TPX10035.1 hypothetical protein E0L32_001232 [Thyridium curvatum]